MQREGDTNKKGGPAGPPPFQTSSPLAAVPAGLPRPSIGGKKMKLITALALVAGMFLGGTIHDVAQVVGAGYSMGPETGDAATVVKLMRVAMLVPVLVFAAWMTHRLHAQSHDAATASGQAPPSRPPLLPGFAVVFVLLVLGFASGSIGQLKGNLTIVKGGTKTLAVIALGENLDGDVVQNLLYCIKRCDLELAGIASSAYVSAISSLVEDEQELGAACVDFGGGGNAARISTGATALMTARRSAATAPGSVSNHRGWGSMPMNLSGKSCINEFGRQHLWNSTAEQNRSTGSRRKA